MKILLKVGPDMTDDDLKRTVDDSSLVDGYVATNTTVSREGLPARLAVIPRGGASGSALEDRATLTIARIHEFAPSKPIIGVGGIHDFEGIEQKRQAGATIYEIMTGYLADWSIFQKLNMAEATRRRRLQIEKTEQPIVIIMPPTRLEAELKSANNITYRRLAN